MLLTHCFRPFYSNLALPCSEYAHLNPANHDDAPHTHGASDQLHQLQAKQGKSMCVFSIVGKLGLFAARRAF